MNTITIEQLAERMGETVWSKDDLKRIYLNDAGWNTKKMSTKTFIFQTQDGDFKVSCHVDCPSQPWQWCKSQEDEVKDNIQRKIENVLADAENSSEATEEIVSEMVKITDKAVIATGKQINDSGLFPHIKPSDKELILWVFDKNIGEKQSSWMPVVDVTTTKKEIHTHKIGNFHFILPTTETHTDYCFENWLKNFCKIERLQEPTTEMKDIRGNKKSVVE